MASTPTLTKVQNHRETSKKLLMDKNSRVHTNSGRFYQVEDGERFPSVTTILQAINKPALVNWAAKEERTMVLDCSANLYEDVASISKMSRMAWLTTMEFRLGKEKAHRKLLAKAGELGSQTHEMIEWTLHKMMGREMGAPPKIQDKAMWAFMAWEDWAKSVDLKPLLIEQVVYSRKYGFAGTLDLLAEIKGKVTVVDWKTGKAVYDEAHLQNAAYRVAIREMRHADPVAGMMVRLPKVETDPEFEVVEAEPEAACFEAFLHVKSVWTWMQIGEAKYQARKKAASEQVSTRSPAGQGVPPQADKGTPASSNQPAASEAGKALPQSAQPASQPSKRKRKSSIVPAAQLTPPMKKNGEALELAPDDPLNKPEPAYVAVDNDCPF